MLHLLAPAPLHAFPPLHTCLPGLLSPAASSPGNTRHLPPSAKAAMGGRWAGKQAGLGEGQGGRGQDRGGPTSSDQQLSSSTGGFTSREGRAGGVRPTLVAPKHHAPCTMHHVPTSRLCTAEVDEVSTTWWMPSALHCCNTARVPCQPTGKGLRGSPDVEAAMLELTGRAEKEGVTGWGDRLG